MDFFPPIIYCIESNKNFITFNILDEKKSIKLMGLEVAVVCYKFQQGGCRAGKYKPQSEFNYQRFVEVLSS
jgi:hypothetical protein